MKITGITYSRYNYNFKNPITTARTVLNKREGIILRIIADEKFVSFGEASPLQDFGSEDINQAENSLKDAVNLIIGTYIPNDFEHTDKLLNRMPLSPTIRFAFEQALFELLLKINSTEQAENYNSVIPVNSLLNFSNFDDTLNKVKEFIEKGYSTIKFKTGVIPFDEEIKLLKTIKKRYPSLKIRLDVNCVWDKETAITNIKQLHNLNIEYIEQPVENAEDLYYVSENSGIAVAADESIRSVEDALRIIESGSIKYLVLKPMLLGGYFKTKNILNAAKDKCTVIISSALETNLGRRFLVYIASKAAKDTAHGLATSNLYLEDPAQDFFPISKGNIDFSINDYLYQLNKQQA